MHGEDMELALIIGSVGITSFLVSVCAALRAERQTIAKVRQSVKAGRYV